MTNEFIVWHYSTGLVWVHTTLKNKRTRDRNAHRILLLGRAKHQKGEMTVLALLQCQGSFY